MSSDGSVTAWLKQLQAGEEEALGRLHARYSAQLRALSHGRLNPRACRAADEDDLLQESFWEFCRGLRAGRLCLNNRNDFLGLMTTIISRRTVNQYEHECLAQKRP